MISKLQNCKYNKNHIYIRNSYVQLVSLNPSDHNFKHFTANKQIMKKKNDLQNSFYFNIITITVMTIEIFQI